MKSVNVGYSGQLYISEKLPSNVVISDYMSFGIAV